MFLSDNSELNYDYLAVYLVPTTTTPVGGTALTSGQILGPLNNQSSWQSSTYTISDAYAGTTQRLVFTWINDGFSGTDPSGTIDNVGITYTSLPPCSGTPVPGNTIATPTGVSVGGTSTLTLQNAFGFGSTYQWYSSTTSSSGPWTPIASATNSTYIASPSTSTWYYCAVSCAGNTGNSTPVQVLVVSCITGLYSTGCTSSDYINDITVSDLNQTATGCTGGTGIADYTSTIVNFLQGGSYPWTITCGTTNEWVGFWIDFNDNGSFGDAGEFVGYNSSASTATTISSNSSATQVNIPSNATTGLHRMRVRLVYNSQQSLSTSCTYYTYGETHDYTANITSPCTAPTTQASNVNFTSTGTTSTTINWTSGNGNGAIVVVRPTATAAVNPSNGTIYSANTTFGSGSGSAITGTGNYVVFVGTGNSVTVTGLSSNTSYTATVYEYNTASQCYNMSGASNSVTTNCLNMAGTYSVGSSNLPGEAGHYATLTAAVNAYNTNCITGPILFSLTDATYPSETFPITINSNSYASSVNTLTIKPAAGVNASITGNSSSAIIRFNGADYVTIDGSNSSTTNSVCPRVQASRNLTITNTNSNTTQNAVVWLQSTGSNGSTYNVIKNCNIVGNSSTTTFFGIGSADNTIQPYNTNGGQNNNYNQFINNGISNVQLGILSVGQSTSNRNVGTVINLNDITSCKWGGIFIGYENGTIISGNTVNSILQTSNEDAFGIGVGLVQILTGTTTATSECINVTVSYNTIGTVRQTGSYSAAGIIFGSSSSGTHTIVNNMISGVSSNATLNDYVTGMHIGGGAAQYNIYHNTVLMQGTISPSSAGVSTCVAINNSTYNVDLRNNILYNNQINNTNATRFVCIAMASSSFTNLNSNYNDLIAAGSGSGSYSVAMYGGISTGSTLQTTLGNWQSASGKDGNSISLAPVFTSSSDLHLQQTSANINIDNKGTPIASVTNDIDCDIRSMSTPDIGADEFSVCTVSISPTTSTICSGLSTTLSSTATNPSNPSETPTYTWSSNPSGYSASTQNVTVSPTTTTTYTLSAAFTGCTATATSVVTVINPTVSVNSPTVCSGSSATVTATPSIVGTYTYAWTVPGGGSNPGNVASFTTSVAGTYTVTVTGTYCSFNGSGTVTLQTPFDLNASSWSANPICTGGSTATYTAVPSIAATYTYAWSVPGGATNPGNAASITASTAGTYTVTATNAACTATSTTTLTVNSVNTINLTSATGTDNQTKCLGNAITNITYATTNATGATFSGLPAGVSGVFNAGVVTISGTPTDIAGTYNYTVTLTGGCGGGTASGSITLLSSSTILLNSANNVQPPFCLGNALSTINYNTGVLTGMNVTGLPGGVSSASSSGTTTISGTPLIVGTYNYTLSTNEGCSASGTITVNGAGTITLTSAAGTNSQTVCKNSAITNITYATTSSTGATISWSPSTPTGVSFSWASNVATISGTPSVAGNFTYTINTSGGCGGSNATISGSLTVNATPSNATVSVLSSTCSGQQAVFTINGTAGTTVSYTLNGVANTISLSSSTAQITVSNVTSNQTVALTSVSNGTCSIALNSSATTTVSTNCVNMTDCNLVAMIIGNGSTAISTSSNGAFQSLVQERFTSDGSNNSTISNGLSPNFTDNSGSPGGSNNLLTNEGYSSSTSTGFLNSYNGVMGVPGYSSSVGTTSVSATNTKAVSLINGTTGQLLSRTLLPTSGTIPFNSQTFRSVIPISSTTFYAAGTGNSNTGGIWYVDITNPASPVYNQLLITSGNVRNIEIYNGNLYFSGTGITPNGGSSSNGIFQLGIGLPTSGSQTVTSLITNGGTMPNGFAISPDGCTLYLADASNAGSNAFRGITKWSKSSGTWTKVGSNYSPQSGSNYTYALGLTVDFSGTENKLYFTGGYSNLGANTVINNLYAVKETADNATATWTSLFSTVSTVSAGTTYYRFGNVDFTPNSYKPFNITSQPQNTSTCVGASTTLSVSTDYSGTVNYQWYENTTSSLCATGWTAVGTNSPTYTFTPSTTGTKYYYVKVWTSCASVQVSSVATVTMNSGNLITANLTSSNGNPFCSGSSTTLTASASGGTASTYTWSVPSGVTNPGNQATLTTSTAGNYAVTITSTQGCSATNSIPLTTQTCITCPSITDMTTTLCSGSSVSVSPINGVDGTVPSGVQYTWSAPSLTNATGGSAQSTPQASIADTPLTSTATSASAVYTVSAQLTGCSNTTFTVTMNVSNPPGILQISPP